MASEAAVIPGILLSDLVVREERTGKLSLIGCFQQFSFPNFPIRMAKFFVTVGITNLRGAPKEVNVTCRIEVPTTGHVIASHSGKVEFDPTSPPTPHAVVELPFQFNGVIFNEPGQYAAVILVDNEEVQRRPFEVSKAPPPTK